MIKLLLVCILAVVIIFNTGMVAQAIETEKTSFSDATRLASEIIQVNDLLKSVGLKAKDLTRLPKVSEEFLQEYMDIINQEYSKTHTTTLRNNNFDLVYSTNTESPYFKGLTKEISTKITDDFAGQWDFANSVAKMNMKRDSSAKGEMKETVYMYMSHFIDIKNGINNSIEYARSISDDDYFSSWITNNDRNTYDSYFEGVRDGKNFLAQAEIIQTGISSINSVLELKSCTKNFSEIKAILTNTEDFSRNLYGMYNSFLILMESKNPFNSKEDARKYFEERKKNNDEILGHVNYG